MKVLTVKELMEHLSHCSPDAEAFVVTPTNKVVKVIDVHDGGSEVTIETDYYHSTTERNENINQ